MKKVICKKIIVFLSVVALSLGIIVSVPAASATFSSVVIGNTEAYLGDQVSIPISIYSGSGNSTFSGLSVSITYNSDLLSYVAGGDVVKCNEMQNDFSLHSPSKSKVNIAWYGDEISVPSGTNLFNLCFKVNPDADVDAISVTLNIDSIYTYSIENGKVSWHDVPVTSAVVTGNITVKKFENSSSQVQIVINKINAIGTVTYSEESLNLIVDAASAYSMLTVDQQKNVTNYQLLCDAKADYEAAKLNAQDSVLKSKVDNFNNQWSNVLSLTVTTVKLTDEESINSCLTAFNALDTDVRYQLFSCNKLFKALLNQIKLLKNEQKAEEVAKQQKSEAEQLSSEFKSDYSSWTKLSLNQITAEHWNGLSAALEVLETLESVNPYISQYLSSEKMILQSLLEKAEELKLASGEVKDVDEVNAAKFKRNFAYLISLNSEDITGDDYTDIMVAIEVYKMQSSDVQELLSEEYKTLSGMLKIAQDKQDSENNSDKTEEEDKTPVNEIGTAEQVTVKSTGLLSDLLINFSNRTIGWVVIIMVMLLIVSAIIFAVLRVFYHLYFVKKIS